MIAMSTDPSSREDGRPSLEARSQTPVVQCAGLNNELF